MSQYNSGTISATTGSAIITGIGTGFILDGISVNDLFIVTGDSVVYVVASIDSQTQITLASNYAGTTTANSSYIIHMDFTPSGIPLMQSGDVETVSIYNYAVNYLDTYMPFNFDAENAAFVNVANDFISGQTIDGNLVYHSGNLPNAVVDETADYNWTGNHTFNVATTSDFQIIATDDVANRSYYAAFIDFNLSGADTVTADRTKSALRIDIDSSATGGTTTDEHRIYGIYLSSDVTGDTDLNKGIYATTSSNPSTGQATTTYAIQGTATGRGRSLTVAGVNGTSYARNSADIDTLSGGYFKAFARYTTETIVAADTVQGVYAEVEIGNNSGTTDAFYGVRSEIDNNSGAVIPAISGDSNAYLFYGNYAGVLPSVNNWGVYINDDVPSYFGGEIQVQGNLVYHAGNLPDAVVDVTADYNWTGAHTFQGAGGGEVVRIKDSGGVGAAANPYLGFYDSADSRLGYVGFGSTGNSSMYLVSDGGDIHLNGNGVYISNNTVWHSGNLIDPMGEAVNLGASVNLNTITNTGLYHQNSNSNAGNGSNYPVGRAGMLTVKKNANSVHVYQDYYDYANTTRYFRSYYNGTWTSWETYWTSGNTPKITVATSAPSSPATNDIWVDIS